MSETNSLVDMSRKFPNKLHVLFVAPGLHVWAYVHVFAYVWAVLSSVKVRVWFLPSIKVLDHAYGSSMAYDDKKSSFKQQNNE